MSEKKQHISTLQNSIITYYDATRLDYRVLWANRKNRAIHFGYYDEKHLSHSSALENMNRVMAKEAGISASDRVLDAGCGQGGSSLWLAENVGCHVVGITLVPHQVDVARIESKKRNLEDKLNFDIKDYTETGFKDESFSVIWACESVCHSKEKIAFYLEAFRLLKPGGRLVMAEYIRQSRNLNSSDELVLNQWCDGWSMPDLDTWEEHLKNLTDIGFVHIKNEDITNNVRPSLKRLFKMSDLLLNLGRLLHGLKIRNAVKHGNQLASIRQYEALDKNLWYYGLVTAVKPL